MSGMIVNNRHLSQQASMVLLLAVYALASMAGTGVSATHSYPGGVSLFSQGNKLEDKVMPSESMADTSFHQFMKSASPDSTVIGELKPNASALELLVLKNKIADTILSMQEMERARHSQQQQLEQSSLGSSSQAECYVGVTKVERVPGKCRKVNDGLPICQAENYMAINMDCS